jgi:hypothetical protein
MSGHLARRSGIWACAAALAVAIWWLAGAGLARADAPPPDGVDPVPNGLCFMCHGQAGLTTGPNGEGSAIAPIDQTTFANSVHGAQACVSCHFDQSELPHLALAPVGTAVTAADCATCHKEAAEGYLESPHGTMADLKDSNGPTCESCHGNIHTIKPVAQWTTDERAAVCANCHGGAGTGFLKALSHKAPSPSSLPFVYFAGRFLTLLAASSLAFGIIHVELDLLRWLVRRWRHVSAGEGRWDSI